MSLRKMTPPCAVVIALGIACSEGTGPSEGEGSVTLRIVAGSSPVAAAAPDSVRVAGHLLVLEQVEIVLREIKLKRANGSDACARSGDDHGEKNGRDHADRDCRPFVTGPLLVDLPLGGAPEKLVTVDVDAGTYRRVKFKLHKPDNDDGDASFLAEHPDFRNVSVRVRGTFDGRDFEYLNDVTAEQESLLDPPLEVTERASRNLTLVVDAATWFIRGGVGLIDPMSALDGEPNENVVRDNIKRSFRLFEDDDADGDEDDDDHDEDDDDDG